MQICQWKCPVIHQKRADLDVSMSFKIEFGEATHVATAINMDSKVTEEINDSGRASREREPEHEWCQHNRQQLMCEDDDLYCEQFPKFLMNLRVCRISISARVPAQFVHPRTR